MEIGMAIDEPTVYITAAASEMALVIANITPVTIPGSAAGKITLYIVCHLVAPSP